jgi:hypothetical protein
LFSFAEADFFAPFGIGAGLPPQDIIKSNEIIAIEMGQYLPRGMRGAYPKYPK